MNINVNANNIIDALYDCFDDIAEFFVALRKEQPKGLFYIEYLSENAKRLYERKRIAEYKHNTVADVLNVNRSDLHIFVAMARRWYNRTNWNKCLSDADAAKMWSLCTASTN